MSKNKKENVEAIYPLSAMQEGMLFHSLSDPSSTSYFEQYTCTLDGDLNVEYYKKSWQRLVEHNPVLRTLVLWERKDKPLQVVRKTVKLEWQEEDWSDIDSKKHITKLDELLLLRRQKGFNLKKAPLMDMALIKTTKNQYIFVWNFHHLLLDGWSSPLLFNQLFETYKGFLKGEEISLSKIPPYKNYISWLQNQDMSKVENYWKKVLSGFTTPIKIDFGKSDAVLTTEPTYEKTSVELTENATALLQQLARKNHVTLNTIIQGCWALLLSQYGREDDVVFGATVSGRPSELAGVEEIVGLFINTLPVRVKLDYEEAVFDWLKKLQLQQLESKEYEHSPLVEVQKWSDIPAGESLFNSLVVFENYPTIKDEKDALGFSISDEYTREETNYPLSIGVEVYEKMLLNCIYDMSLYDYEQIQRMLHHFKNALENIANNPYQKLKSVSLLNEKDKQNILIDWNNTHVPHENNKCVHELIEDVALQNGKLIALHDDLIELNYEELNVRANALAVLLQKYGVGPNTCVGVYLNRNARVPVALLAILKAGGAYLPIDPKYPEERIRFMLGDANVSVLISEKTLHNKLLPNDIKSLLIDEIWDDLIINVKPKLHNITHDDLAYVIYTSGSTGLPKGVEISHGSLHNLVKWHQRTYSVMSEDKASLLAGLAFDASVWEIWPYLSSGSTLFIPDDDVRLSPPLTIKWLIENKITLCFMPTPLAEAILAEDIPNEISLRYLFTGGDKLHSINNINIPFKLVNHYGPTENTVISTSVEIDVSYPEEEEPSIGFPIDNTQVYVLNKYQQPVPIGVAGELCVAGVGLARRYVNQPELTTTSFVCNSFTGQQMYKTGDLVRFLADGRISFIGRIDEQVKIHGYRIELGEIESVITQIENVKKAIVVVHGDNSTDKKLVAYIVFDSNDSLTNLEVRDILKAKLPSYMVPAYYMVLDALPLTTNGKVDRKALPAPDESDLVVRSEFSIATNEREKQLSDIWCAVLRLSQVGIHDNFFELGGDSILSIQIIARANQCDIHLTPRLLFKYPTISELALHSEGETKTTINQEVVTGDAQLMPIQQWFFEQEYVNQHHWNQAYLLTLPSDIELKYLEQSFNFILEHHDALRMSYSYHDNAWQQTNKSKATLEVQYINLSEVNESEQSKTLESKASDLQSQLDIGNGNLIQVAMFDYGKGKSKKILIAIHHLVIDGVSWRILLEDLNEVYKILKSGGLAKLRDKTISFLKWGDNQKKLGQSELLLSETDYWLSLPTVSKALPVDYKKYGDNTRASEEIMTVSLSMSETESLLKDIPSVYNTQINDVLLTALVLTFNEWTRESEFILHMEGHGREELDGAVDLSRTVGWFTALYPVLLNLDGTVSIEDALMLIKEQLRCIPNHGVGFGMLRYLSNKNIQESLKKLAEPEVLFNYLGQFDQMFDDASIFQLAEESCGLSCDINGDRQHLLEINALIVNRQLKVEWSYSRNIYKQKTIQKIANSFIKKLQSIIEHCLLPEAGGFTVSDFPLAKINVKQLNHLILSATNDSSDIKNIENVYPLSPMQEGMLYHSLLEPESGFYFEQYHCTFNTSIDINKFKNSWQIAIDKHPVLRTAFFWDDLDRNLQVVYKNVNLPFDFLDWSSDSTEVQTKKLSSFLSDDQLIHFKLNSAPLMRITLIRIEGNEYRFIWSYHHLLLDGWSMPILLSEIADNYKKLSENQLVKKNHPRPYFDYIFWLSEQNNKKSKNYWKRFLSGVSAPTSLYALENEKIQDEQSFVEFEFKIPEKISVNLKELSKKHQVTLNTIFQCAWGILLSHYSNEHDVIFGATVSGRPAEMKGVESMVGLFINTLPVHLCVKDDTSFISWAKETQENQLEMREYEFSSLVDIHSWSEIPHTEPLFESLFVFENYPVVVDSENDILKVSDIHLAEKTNFPLNVIIQPYDEIVVDIIYDNKRFNENKINKIGIHFNVLMESIVQNADEKIRLMSYIGKEEKRLISLWNATEKDYPHKCIHQLTEKQAALSANNIAISFSKITMTFGELDEKANKLAHYIQSLGVKTGVLVGLCVERSPEMIVAILAILKSGAAYLPLDPYYPRERIAYILDDAKVTLLVTESLVQNKLEINNCECLILNDLPDIQYLPSTPPISSVNPNDIAYVIYTSGSTGKPKGVLVPHKSVSNFITSMAVEPGIRQEDVLLAVTTLSFDIAVLEIFLPLTTGAHLVLADRATASDGALLMDVIESSAVTIMQATPVTWRLLLEAGWKKTDDFKVLCGGEKMPTELASKLLSCASSVWNMYGPTETTVWSSIYRLQNQDILIGKPIANTKIHILDENMRLLPIGVIGEMYISGVGVTNGYLNKDELTQERFIKNQTLDCDETLLYRTGDLVKYHLDGNIQYINRIDNQVKLRGFRIELGEIESVINECEGIEQVVAIVREDNTKDARLVAYFTIQKNENISVTTLRKYLRSLLPDYMIPQHFVELDEMPVTPNGKVDFLALPIPFNTGVIEDDHVKPSTTNEKLLAEIWKEILKVDKISINDNFFEIGGHSLLSVQAITKLKDKTGIKMELRLMVMDTLEQIAAQFPDADDFESKKEDKSIRSKSFLNKIKTIFSSD